MSNLYEELESFLSEYDLSISDIKWVGTYSYTIPINDFIKLARKTRYDSNYGSQEIATDLLIVGDEWWITRYEYDGAEGFEIHAYPDKPNAEYKNKVYTLKSRIGWETLKEINNF